MDKKWTRYGHWLNMPTDWRLKDVRQDLEARLPRQTLGGYVRMHLQQLEDLAARGVPQEVVIEMLLKAGFQKVGKEGLRKALVRARKFWKANQDQQNASKQSVGGVTARPAEKEAPQGEPTGVRVIPGIENLSKPRDEFHWPGTTGNLDDLVLGPKRK